MFDTIAGLPLHALIVHGVVVGLPVAAILTVLVAVRPAWRRFALPVVVLNGLVMIMAFVATRSGEALEKRVTQFNVPEGLAGHEQWGQRLFIVSILVFVASLVLHLVRARTAIATGVAVVLVLLCVAAAGLTAVVGHSGATMVWKSVIDSTSN